MRKIKWDVLFTWIVIIGFTIVLWGSVFSFIFGFSDMPLMKFPIG